MSSNMLQALVRELQNDVHLIRRQIRELKKMQKNRDACKTSTHKAHYRVGMGREPEEWDVRAGKGLVGGDDFRDMMILELGS